MEQGNDDSAREVARAFLNDPFKALQRYFNETVYDEEFLISKISLYQSLFDTEITAEGATEEFTIAVHILQISCKSILYRLSRDNNNEEQKKVYLQEMINHTEEVLTLLKSAGIVLDNESTNIFLGSAMYIPLFCNEMADRELFDSFPKEEYIGFFTELVDNFINYILLDENEICNGVRLCHLYLYLQNRRLKSYENAGILGASDISMERYEDNLLEASSMLGFIYRFRDAIRNSLAMAFNSGQTIVIGNLQIYDVLEAITSPIQLIIGNAFVYIKAMNADPTSTLPNSLNIVESGDLSKILEVLNKLIGIVPGDSAYIKLPPMLIMAKIIEQEISCVDMDNSLEPEDIDSVQVLSMVMFDKLLEQKLDPSKFHVRVDTSFEEKSCDTQDTENTAPLQRKSQRSIDPKRRDVYKAAGKLRKLKEAEEETDSNGNVRQKRERAFVIIERAISIVMEKTISDRMSMLLKLRAKLESMAIKKRKDEVEKIKGSVGDQKVFEKALRKIKHHEQDLNDLTEEIEDLNNNLLDNRKKCNEIILEFNSTTNLDDCESSILAIAADELDSKMDELTTDFDNLLEEIYGVIKNLEGALVKIEQYIRSTTNGAENKKKQASKKNGAKSKKKREHCTKKNDSSKAGSSVKDESGSKVKPKRTKADKRAYARAKAERKFQKEREEREQRVDPLASEISQLNAHGDNLKRLEGQNGSLEEAREVTPTVADANTIEEGQPPSEADQAIHIKPVPEGIGNLGEGVPGDVPAGIGNLGEGVPDDVLADQLAQFAKEPPVEVETVAPPVVKWQSTGGIASQLYQRSTASANAIYGSSSYSDSSSHIGSPPAQSYIQGSSSVARYRHTFLPQFAAQAGNCAATYGSLCTSTNKVVSDDDARAHIMILVSLVSEYGAYYQYSRPQGSSEYLDKAYNNIINKLSARSLTAQKAKEKLLELKESIGNSSRTKPNYM